MGIRPWLTVLCLRTLRTGFADPHKVCYVVGCLCSRRSLTCSQPPCPQVFGDAVIDEAPLLILTNYHVTVFLKRSDDARDKQLWASAPIWYDQTDPPPRACWAHGLQQAAELRSLKQKLPRALVPPTAKGSRTQRSMQQAQGQQAAADRAGGARASSRQRAAAQRADEAGSSARPMRACTIQARARLEASIGPKGKGRQVDRHSPPEPLPAAGELADAAAEETLTFAELGLTGELLGGGQHGHTLKVSHLLTVTPVCQAPAV